MDPTREVVGTRTFGFPTRNGRGTTAAAWGAVAAVAIPSALAVRALIRNARYRRDRQYDPAVLAARRKSTDSEITPPHGDKLLSRRASR
jgi:hypothetical protein